jgi:hypothetical protein
MAVGQIYIPKGAEELRDQWLRDFRLAAIDAGVEEPPVHPGTDAWMKATAAANLALIGLSNVAIAESDSNVLEAEGAPLDRQRVALTLPEETASPSSGAIVVRVDGATTITSGTQLVLPNGLRIRVVGNYMNPADRAEVDVIAIDSGTATNLAAREKVRFVAPPANVREEATVSESRPLAGGTDVEDTERKRRRILNALRVRPAGGNWSQLREVAIQSLGSIADAFVYPAIGGPGSAKVVPVTAFDRQTGSYSRVPPEASVAVVRAAIHALVPSPMEIVVQAPDPEPLDVSIRLDLPPSVLAGGTGQGWTDPAPWPTLEPADGGRVTVTSANGISLTVTAQTATAPLPAQTSVAWWSPLDQRFYTALVVAQSGSAGAWSLTLDAPLVDSAGDSPQIGDFVCPAAFNLAGYGTTWINLLESLGPGENVGPTVDHLPRRLRHPFTRDESPASVSNATLRGFVSDHDEVAAVSLEHASASSPPVPATLSDAPKIFEPRHFAIYPE